MNIKELGFFEIVGLAGVFCMLYAIIGQGITLMALKLPLITSAQTRVLLGIVGFMLTIPAIYTNTFSGRDPVDRRGSDPPGVYKGAPASEARTVPPPAKPLSLAGFFCGVRSYGGDRAMIWRTLITDKLTNGLKCNTDASLFILSDPECPLPEHTYSRSEGPMKGFATQNTIIYYTDENMEVARGLATTLHETINSSFDVIKGEGRCVRPGAFKALFIVHVRDDR